MKPLYFHGLNTDTVDFVKLRQLLRMPTYYRFSCEQQNNIAYIQGPLPIRTNY